MSYITTDLTERQIETFARSNSSLELKRSLIEHYGKDLFRTDEFPPWLAQVSRDVIVDFVVWGTSHPHPDVAATPEPPPQAKDGRALWDLVIADVRSFRWLEHREPLVRQMLARDAYGLQKYGTRLQAFNGRNPLVDMLQEVLDAVVYTCQAMAEGNDDIVGLYYELLKIADQLVGLMEE